ncbi:pyridoxamine 5'-phosphate oxidase family protein [soil metagenome]
MGEHRNDIEILDVEECNGLLRDTLVGRLAVDISGRPEIFPINYVVTDHGIVFRSGAGTKLAGAVLMHHVAFEIDGYEPENRTAWSVVVKGWARPIERMQDVYDAEDLPLFPWVVSPKPNFVCIEPREITGRRFYVADDIVTDASLGWTEDVDHHPDDDLGVRPQPGVGYHSGAPRLHPD